MKNLLVLMGLATFACGQATTVPSYAVKVGVGIGTVETPPARVGAPAPTH